MGKQAERKVVKTEVTSLQRKIGNKDAEIRGIQRDLQKLERSRNPRLIDRISLNQQLKKARAERAILSARLRRVKHELRSYDPDY